MPVAPSSAKQTARKALVNSKLNKGE